nr:retrotransposable element Tf2 [Tanacetum cinerariifolium]
MGYDFELHYKPGKENKVADALSRPEQIALMAISIPTAAWLEDLRAYYRSNPEGQQLLQKITSNAMPSHTHHNGLVFFQGRLLVPNIPDLRLLILEEFHASTLGAIFLKDIYHLHGIPNSITSEATWEDWLEFMHRFPVFVGHEDISAVQGETNDTPEPSAAVQTKAAQDKARPTRIIKKPSRYLE